MNLAYLLSVVMLFAVGAQGSPFFNFFFGNTNNRGLRPGYSRRPKSRSFGGGYNDYKRMCSVINPHPYALIGSNPYPAVPFCPP